jgi:hypothetical protein
MTTVVEGGEGSALCPGCCLPPGKTRYPLYRRVGGPHGRSGQVWKISPPLGFDPWIVQPVASRYTNWATQPTTCPYGALKTLPHHAQVMVGGEVGWGWGGAWRCSEECCINVVMFIPLIKVQPFARWFCQNLKMLNSFMFRCCVLNLIQIRQKV